MGHQVSLDVSFLTLQRTITIDVQWHTSAIVQAYPYIIASRRQKCMGNILDFRR